MAVLGWSTGRRALSALALFTISGVVGSAATLNWGSVTPQWTMAWGGAQASTSLDIDPTNAGNDVTIRILLGYGASWAGGGPTIVNGSDGPMLSLNLNSSSTSSIATIRFDFHYADGVRDLQFTTNDIDLNSMNQAEELRGIYATFKGGSQLPGQLSLGSQTTSTALWGSGLGASFYGIGSSNGGADSLAKIGMGGQLDYLQMTFGLQQSYYGYSGSAQMNFNLSNLAWNAAAAAAPPPPPPIYVTPSGDNPEPGTWMLLGTGLFAFAAIRRRKSK